LELTTKMLRDFVDALVEKPEVKNESSYFGTYRVDEDEYPYVIFDGAEVTDQTPCVPLVSCSSGDRVTVTIRDNTCYITGVL